LYLLGLELTTPGFNASVLSEFRGRLVAGGAEEPLLDTLLALCHDLKLSNWCHNDGQTVMAIVGKYGSSWQVQVRFQGCYECSDQLIAVRPMPL
jgi:hypothetical protein